MTKISAQQYADSRVADEFKQPLKTLREAVESIGWDFVDRPICCELGVEIKLFLGCVYFAECSHCGRFIADAVNGPEFGNSWAAFADPEKVVLDTDRVWISAKRPK